MRVLVYGAGGPAGVNVCRSLKEAGHDVVGVDSEPTHLPWVEVNCNRALYAELDQLPKLVDELGIEAIHSQAERGVQWIADNKDRLSCRTFLPDSRVVALSQDKWEACLEFRRKHLRGDKVHLVQDLDGVRDAYLDLRTPFWMRARYGAGARGSALCENIEQAEHWYAYWRARDPRIDFIAEAYLPGRDLAWTSLWHDGTLIASFGRERLEYIYPNLAPSGRTGTPTIARTVHDDKLNRQAMATVFALDPRPHGFYSVDLREDPDGIPRPTEVNAGRCFTTSYLSTAAGLNFMDLWCLLIGCETYPDTFLNTNSIPADLTWMRHIDCPELLLDKDGNVLHEGLMAYS